MMKKTLLFAAFILLCHVGYAQGITLEYNFGYGMYNMSKLKDMLDNTKIPLKNVKTTDDFPGHYEHQGRIGMKFNQIHHAGISLDFMRTAGQKGVADYSGEYYTYLKVKGTRLGAFYEITPRDMLDYIVQPYFRLGTGVVFNNGEAKDQLRIHNILTQVNEDSLGGTNFYIEPGIGCRIRLFNNIALNLSVAYEIDLTKKFTNDNSSGKLVVYPDWSGLRLKGGIVYSIPLNSSKK